MYVYSIFYAFFFSSYIMEIKTARFWTEKWKKNTKKVCVFF
jgi:hypothetical protein